MLKGRSRDTRTVSSPAPAHLTRPLPQQPATRPLVPSSSKLTLRTPTAQRAPLAKPEPDYEVVEFPSEQYVNAKLQSPPPPPPPRPPTGHPAEAGASCGLCGGGGARVRCAECGRRALCASCDDMYHRHPKRRHHQRQALTMTQMRDERPPLPPKAVAPVPPPRRHKLSSASPSPRPPMDNRSATLGPHSLHASHAQNAPAIANNHMSSIASQHIPMPPHLQGKILGSMPYLPNLHHASPVQPQANAMGPLASGWGRPRGSLPGFNVPPNMQMQAEAWESPDNMSTQSWGRPLRRGASVLELGGAMMLGGAGGGAGGGCAGCAQGWRYGSCASLDHPWPAWPPAMPPACCAHVPAQHTHAHAHSPYTPQPYRRADSRAVSRAASRACSRAASPAMSTRSRTSRRTKHRTPSPPPLPSSDADSESESDRDQRPPPQNRYPEKRQITEASTEESLGPAPAPPSAPWQCEHCTFVNEPGVRVCVVCCRTPTAAPKVLQVTPSTEKTRKDEQCITDSAKAIADTARSIARLDVNERANDSPSPSPLRTNGDTRAQNGITTRTKTVTKKERVSTGCGPSPPREEQAKRTVNRLVTPTREASIEPSKHDIAVGSSPPKELQSRTSLANKQDVKASPFRESTKSETPTRHSVSVGPSPPREEVKRTPSFQKKSAGTSPPGESRAERQARTNVSNTGTSPPPQSISTQTYEVPNSWERAPSRSRRRFREDARRERSHSRHSLSSDTRESERSARTSGGGGGGRWEWRERDSSPGGEWSGSERRPRPARPARLARRASHLDLHRAPARPHNRRASFYGSESDSSLGGEWSGSERRPRPARPARLARRASHLDLHRAPARPHNRRASFYGSEAASPEPTRAMSLEALAGASAAAERGLELARLMEAAERLGFSAAEVQTALAQSPGAPLGWLRERWPSLCAGVRAAAARLEPRAQVTDLEARAALARHRGAMWPAVTDCVERYRRQMAGPAVAAVAAVTGRVWGSPAGAEDDAAPPRRAEGSSDEYEGLAPTEFRDDWMYLPLDANPKARAAARAVDLLVQAADTPLDDPLLRSLLPPDAPLSADTDVPGLKPQALEFIQSENDFIEAYNALTRSTPLPVQEQERLVEPGPKRDTYDVFGNDSHSYFDNIIDMNAKNDVTAERPSNIFKEITNEHRHNNQENKHPHHFEAISTNVQTSRMPASPEKVITDDNELANISKNGQKRQKEPSQEKEIKNQLNPLQSISNTEQVTNNNENLNIISVHTELQNNVQVPQNGNENEPRDKLRVDVSHPHTVTKKSGTRETVISNIENDLDQRQNEDKQSNLNDIVDNTQRLIQQMKEEINSDINSIDTRNTSQSECESSSNESDISTEHESSYSESEEESDNQSSNNESSDTDSEEKQLSERRPTIIHRTSSEENDQFEEAMDHIEDQIEDFKLTNIEILDSIARSLQEEQRVSIEINEPKIVIEKRQDRNNNLFIKVNSFEEIYAEINNSKEKEKSPITHDIQNNLVLNNSNLNNNKLQIDDENLETQEKAMSLPKYDIVLTTFQATSPTKLLFIENTQNVYNAVLDAIKDTESTNEIPENDITTGEITESETSVNGIEINIEKDLSLNYTDQTLEENIEINTTNIKQSESPDLNDANHLKTNEVSLDIAANNTHETINDHEQTPTNEDNTEDNNTDSEEKQLSERRPTLIRGTSSEENLNVMQNEVAEEEQNDESLNIIEDQNKNESLKTQPIFNNTNIHLSAENISKSNSMANRTLNSIKSNIPKLIKFVQNNKQKSDKMSPKIISSKVPVRRTSQKQYPAPAPPKSHFGNIQSGHVKQLQTRLFNNKFPKAEVHIPTTVEVKPSTSTLHKKKPAPPPPTAQIKQMSPAKTSSPPKEKKDNFFRESCRTEDEWTESDSEESQIHVARNNEEPERVPSPPPPMTLRRVSGQIVDLTKVQLPEGSPERQARMLLAQGATETWEQARLAVELAARGAAAPAALLAALECADLSAALAYLHQDCELCASRLPEHEMVSMLKCTHRCCEECARHYFTVQITERSIADCVCPYCKEPDLENMAEDAWLEYFAHLDILLKTLLEADVHELFQRKLRDRTLARDPNFRWCMECSSGFFVHPKQKKIRCPECRSVSCAKCRKAWSANHEGVSCERYAAWLEDNDPERSTAAVQQHLRENGLECPRCHFKYSLSRGGCMHFTCTQCKYEFCYGCGKPFMMGARCGLSEYCAKLGLHAHHPRNCLFYLRDKEPHQLQTLLQMNNVEFETESAEGSTNRCPIQLQRETPTGLVDGTCGGDVPPKHAGLCKNHYLEYLSRLVRARGVDPLPLLDVEDLETLVRRAALRPPPRPYGSLDGVYRRALTEIVKDKIPLD